MEVLMNISSCGLICDECRFFQTDCHGCYNIKGQPFWTKEFTESGICPLYECAVDINGYASCGSCPDLPCNMFRDLKDPNVSDKEHRESIGKRVSILRNG
jgi:hypothetical protein